MTKERKIINEKLRSIDHKLPVDALWSRLEKELPPKKKRRVLNFWMWSFTLFGIILLGGIWFKTSHKLSLKETTSLTSISESNSFLGQDHSEANLVTTQEEANKQEYTESLISKKDIQISSSSDLSSISSNINSKRFVKPLNEESKPTENRKLKNNEGGEATFRREKAYINIEKEDFHTPENISPQISQEKMALLNRYLIDPKMEEGNAKEKSAGMNLIISALPSPISPLLLTSDSKVLLASPEYTEVPLLAISPVPQMSKWSVAVGGSYGINLDNISPYRKKQKDIFSQSEETSNYQHLDVWNTSISLGYDVSKRFGLELGVGFQRLTDKSTKIEQAADSFSSLDQDRGYKASSSLGIYSIYDTYESVYISIAGNYKIPLARSLFLKPSLGVSYNLWSKYPSEASPIANNAGFILNEDLNASTFADVGFSNNKVSLFSELSVGYIISDHVDINVGIGYRMSTNFINLNEEYQRDISSLSLLGAVRYHF